MFISPSSFFYIDYETTLLSTSGMGVQTQGITIGSGAVESTIKQISRRIKISGAQWKRDNLPQVLRHRCTYLNLA